MSDVSSNSNSNINTYGTGIAFGEARYPDNIIGHLRSQKMRSLMPFRTDLMRDYMILCEYESHVHEYRAFPFSLDFIYDSRAHQFMPDLLVIRGSVPTLVYCQNYENWQSQGEKLGLGLATVWCMERGCELEIVTSEAFYSGPYVQNVRLLRALSQHPVSQKGIDAVTEHLKSAGQPLTIESLAEKIGSLRKDYWMGIILHMAYYHLITLPVHTEDITPETVARLPDDLELMLAQSA